jgi:hypothetical protein
LRGFRILQGGNVNINAQDITNTASNITANNLDITANNLNIATQQNTTDLKAGGGDNYSKPQSTKHQGSNLKVTGNLNISGGGFGAGTNTAREQALSAGLHLRGFRILDCGYI